MSTRDWPLCCCSSAASWVRYQPRSTARGQTLYVPVYSEIPYGDRDQTLDLTVTLSIRNSDRKVAVMVRKVDYYNAKGELVRSFAQAPIDGRIDEGRHASP